MLSLCQLPHSPCLPISSITCLYHAVIKESSSTTKLRVVFDASAKTTSGVSLNDCLTIGPALFPNITDILIRFRTYAVALTSDISKRYRAVELCEQDRGLH